MSSKILTIYPEFGINGVKTYVKDLYNEDYWRKNSWRVKKIGIWFDEKLSTNFENPKKAKSPEEKEEIKKELKKGIENYNPDVIHINTFAIDIDILKWLIKKYLERIVYTVHSVYPRDIEISSKWAKWIEKEVGIDMKTFLSYLQNGSDFSLSNIDKDSRKTIEIARYIYTLQKFLLENSPIVVYVSDYIKDVAERYFGKTYKGVVIKEGTDIFQKYNEDKLKISLEWRRKNFGDKIVVSYVGRVTEEKGVLDLIEAFKKIKDDSVVLYIAGPYRREMEEKIIETSGEDFDKRIFISESKGTKEPLLVYLASDILVYPSYEESFGLVPIEAASLGRDVIVRYSSNLKSFVDEGIARGFSNIDELARKIKELVEIHKRVKNGFYGASEEELNTVEKYLKHKREVIKKVREEYSWNKVREEYRKLFENLLYQL